MASPWQREGWTPVQHVCKHTAEPVTAGICWVSPSSSSKDWLFPIARGGDGQGDGQGRRCCPLALSPAEKGLMEQCVCVCRGVCHARGRAPCPAGRCRAHRGPRSSRFSAGALGASTPRQSARLQNPRDVRWELLQHARKARAIPASPRHLAQQVLPAPGRGAARTPCPLRCPLLRPRWDTPRGQGEGHSPAFHPHLCWVSPQELALGAVDP